MAGSDEDRGFSFDLGMTPTPLPVRRPLGAPGEPELDHLDLDLGDLGLSAQSSSALPPTAVVAEPPPRRSVATGPSLGAAPWGGGPSAPAPAVKAIAFPRPPAESSRARSDDPEERRSAPAAAPRPRTTRTHFSASVGTARPLLESVDDLADLAVPEDLPEDAAQPARPVASPDSWGVLWRRARLGLRQGGGEALELCRQRALAGRRFALEFQKALREQHSTVRAGSIPASSAEAPSAQPPSSTVESPTPTAKAAAPSAARPRAPSPVRTIRLGAPWQLPAMARKLAAPAATLALAFVVYGAGSHLLGGITTPHLSKSTAPDLGTLPDAPTRETTTSVTSGAAAGPHEARSPKNPSEKRPAVSTNASPAGPRVEQVLMPADLSYPGKGLIEVVTAEDELIYVNGVFIGRGPLRRVPVGPGEHEISIRGGSTERHGSLQVETGRCARALFVEAP